MNCWNKKHFFLFNFISFLMIFWFLSSLEHWIVNWFAEDLYIHLGKTLEKNANSEKYIILILLLNVEKGGAVFFGGFWGILEEPWVVLRIL